MILLPKSLKPALLILGFSALLCTLMPAQAEPETQAPPSAVSVSQVL